MYFNQHTTQDSFSFVNDFINVQSQGKFLISFDVESLFTNIPLNETKYTGIGLQLSFESNIIGKNSKWMGPFPVLQ